MRQFLPLALAILLAAGCAAPPGPSGQAPPPLFPAIEPFRTGHLKVSDLHEIYYELSGNPEGIPVFGLHGGPGGSSSPVMRRFTDPSKFLVVLHDQRGAGKSLPSGEVRENDTWKLVEDIERLRTELGLDRIVLFGGSWGTTLGLAYAERYPEHVRALVLRGVFLGRQEEIDHFYHGGSAVHFPDAYAAMLDELPDPGRRPLPEYFYELITTTEGDERRRYCGAWARYEGTLAFLRLDDATRQRIESWVSEEDVCTFSLFENYYMKNHCFLEEGQLLRDAGRLAGIPTYIVQGRYDVICPPSTAWALHRALPGSTLVLADASGHSGSEPEIQRALLGFFREIAQE
jgi:proline iminopeptidase